MPVCRGCVCAVTVFDKSKPMPRWMRRGHECEGYERGKKYYRNIWRAQPVWADTKRIRAIYDKAREMRRAGFNVHVDHVFPLCGDSICGLHIPANLEIVDASDNMNKSNKWYPGREQLDFFKPEYFELEMI